MAVQSRPTPRRPKPPRSASARDARQRANTRLAYDIAGICLIALALIIRVPARRYGSAGQQRTLVLALKLAELELVGSVLGEPPLLLLDDVLAELDPERQQLLLEAVGEGHQCLVSATHLGAFSGGWQAESQVVLMRAGELDGETPTDALH